MGEELIQFPSIPEINEMLADAREEIDEELEDNPDLIPLSKLLFSVIDIIEEKIAKYQDLNDLKEKDKIDIASHICFLNSLEDDFFLMDDDLDDLAFEEVELDDEETSKKKKK